MPTFDFFCTDCEKDFDYWFQGPYSALQNTGVEIKCPACGSERHQKKVSSPAVILDGSYLGGTWQSK